MFKPNGEPPTLEEILASEKLEYQDVSIPLTEEEKSDPLRVIKIEISSILLAHHEPCNAYTIHSMYEENNGEPLVPKNYGFRNIHDLMKACPDRFIPVPQPGGGIKYTVKPNERTKDLRRMVLEQDNFGLRRERARSKSTRRKNFSRYGFAFRAQNDEPVMRFNGILVTEEDHAQAQANLAKFLAPSPVRGRSPERRISPKKEEPVDNEQLLLRQESALARFIGGSHNETKPKVEAQPEPVTEHRRTAPRGILTDVAMRMVQRALSSATRQRHEEIQKQTNAAVDMVFPMEELVNSFQNQFSVVDCEFDGCEQEQYTLTRGNILSQRHYSQLDDVVIAERIAELGIQKLESAPIRRQYPRKTLPIKKKLASASGSSMSAFRGADPEILTKTTNSLANMLPRFGSSQDKRPDSGFSAPTARGAFSGGSAFSNSSKFPDKSIARQDDGDSDDSWGDVGRVPKKEPVASEVPSPVKAISDTTRPSQFPLIKLKSNTKKLIDELKEHDVSLDEVTNVYRLKDVVMANKQSFKIENNAGKQLVVLRGNVDVNDLAYPGHTCPLVDNNSVVLTDSSNGDSSCQAKSHPFLSYLSDEKRLSFDINTDQIVICSIISFVEPCYLLMSYRENNDLSEERRVTLETQLSAHYDGRYSEFAIPESKVQPGTEAVAYNDDGVFVRVCVLLVHPDEYLCATLDVNALVTVEKQRLLVLPKEFDAEFHETDLFLARIRGIERCHGSASDFIEALVGEESDQKREFVTAIFGRKKSSDDCVVDIGMMYESGPNASLEKEWLSVLLIEQLQVDRKVGDPVPANIETAMKKREEMSMLMEADFDEGTLVVKKKEEEERKKEVPMMIPTPGGDIPLRSIQDMIASPEEWPSDDDEYSTPPPPPVRAPPTTVAKASEPPVVAPSVSSQASIPVTRTAQAVNNQGTPANKSLKNAIERALGEIASNDPLLTSHFNQVIKSFVSGARLVASAAGVAGADLEAAVCRELTGLDLP